MIRIDSQTNSSHLKDEFQVFIISRDFLWVTYYKLSCTFLILPRNVFKVKFVTFDPILSII